MRLPTGTTVDTPERNVFAQPIGNNGHFELMFGLQANWRAREYFHISADALYSGVFLKKERIAASFKGATVKNIGPKVNATVCWSYFLAHFNMSFLNASIRPVGCNMGYQLYAKMRDDICLDKQTMKDFFDNKHELDTTALRKRTDVVAHTFTMELFYQGYSHELFGGWSHTFAGKNAPKETSWYLGMTLRF